MEDIRILEVRTPKERARFVDLAFQVYRGDPGWCPLLREDFEAYLRPETNGFLGNGPFAAFLAERAGRPLARVLVGIDRRTNAVRGVKNAWFSLFECREGEEAAARLVMDRAIAFAKEHGAEKLSGPQSPTNGDEFKGFLKEGRDVPAPYLCSWNPSWYTEFFLSSGFTDVHRLFGYRIDKDTLPLERYERVVEYAMRRYRFHVDPIDLKHLDRELDDIGEILRQSILESWEDMSPPTIDELRKQAESLRKVADPALILIARSDEDSRPIGFDLILPDYGEVLRRLNGRMGPIGAIRFLLYRRRITGVRAFAQFVVPDFKHKGVMSAIFLEVFRRGLKKGYTWADASTVGVENGPSLANIESIGARRYKEYWVMSRDLR